MKTVKTTEAVGLILCHDMTQIIKDEFKGPRFKKGHIVREEDIPVLHSMGKETLYVWEDDPNLIHENDAVEVLYRYCSGKNIVSSEIKEGKVECQAACDGLLKIDTKRLSAINELDDIIIATRHGNTVVKKGDKLAGIRVVPLAIQQVRLEAVKALLENGSIIEIMPLQKKKIAIINTGNEIYHGMIKDTFGPVVIQKFNDYGCEIIKQVMLPDDTEMIAAEIGELLAQGAEIVVCTGGMSVDPDDTTPAAIRVASDEVIAYGAPVLPGAMFMLAYKKNRAIMGLPGCVMYAGRTIFDLVLPRVLVGERLSKRDLVTLGEGGFCMNCEVCSFPNCGFGSH